MAAPSTSPSTSPSSPPLSHWISDIPRHAKQIYSQGGQDGALDFIFQTIGTTNKHCVEFGYNSHSLLGGSGPNIGNLVHNHGWSCLLLDGNNENPSINLHKEYLTSENLSAVLSKYNTPKEPDYVSIDVDSCDLWLFQALITDFRPRVVTVEYNSHFPLDHAISYPNDPTLMYAGDRMYGASLKALYKVGQRYGYSLVHVESKLDAFFIRTDLLAGAAIPDLEAFRHYTNLVCHHPCSTGRHDRMIDVDVWLATQDEEAARLAANPVAKQYLS